MWLSVGGGNRCCMVTYSSLIMASAMIMTAPNETMDSSICNRDNNRKKRIINNI